MDDQEPNAFSWTTFFWVTGFSFFLFSGTLKLLNGSHLREFIFAGIVSLLLGAVNWLKNYIVTCIGHKSK